MNDQGIMVRHYWLSSLQLLGRIFIMVCGEDDLSAGLRLRTATVRIGGVLISEMKSTFHFHYTYNNNAD